METSTEPDGTRLFCDIACELGEGPTYDPMSDTAWWFDIEGKCLLERPSGAERAIVHPLPFMASALAVIDGDRHLIAAKDGLYVRETRTGRLHRHLPLEADNEITRSNDARVHPSGALWVGTMGVKAEREAGAIYWYRQGELRLLYPRITIPNSICFSPDGGTAYFADTALSTVMRVDVDPETGLPIGEAKPFYDKKDNQDDDGVGGIDGSVCDADGTLWNARWGAARIDAYSPSGEHLRSIAVDARQVTCPAFVGRNADRMIVTSAWTGLFGKSRQDDPQAGKTFLLDERFQGRHEPRVLL